MTWMPLQYGQGAGAWVSGSPQSCATPAVCPGCPSHLSRSCRCSPTVSHLQVGLVAASERPNNKSTLILGWEAQIWCRECAHAHTSGIGVGLVGSARFPYLKKVPQGAEEGELSHVMCLFPGPGQTMPKPGEYSGPWKLQGQFEELKGIWNCF